MQFPPPPIWWKFMSIQKHLQFYLFGPYYKVWRCSVMIWVIIWWNSLSPLVVLHRRVNGKDYILPDDSTVFQYNYAPIHMANIIQNWYEKHKSQVNHLDCFQLQLLDLDIIKYLWYILKKQLRSCFPLLSLLKDLKQVFLEEWLNFP